MFHQQMSSPPISFHLGVSQKSRASQQMVPAHDLVFLTEWAIRTLKNTNMVKVIRKVVMTHLKSKSHDSFFTGFIRDISAQADTPTSC
ncbi:hypothetical protein TNCV_1467881 [Trichonephila clavipes]|uniref:Uncharacterized protein n=1 Tax=Trichonephila clavipes TaxID=2585209 RepID=A0A8X6RW84_TRICX|nr:hypothetical protein TNCV_1467881 [Trichonephila clavipes]